MNSFNKDCKPRPKFSNFERGLLIAVLVSGATVLVTTGLILWLFN